VCAAGYFDVERAVPAPKLTFAYSFDTVSAGGAARLRARAYGNLLTRFNLQVNMPSSAGLLIISYAYSTILPASFSVSTVGNTSRLGLRG
jgi:hypothetical protein